MSDKFLTVTQEYLCRDLIFAYLESAQYGMTWLCACVLRACVLALVLFVCALVCCVCVCVLVCERLGTYRT